MGLGFYFEDKELGMSKTNIDDTQTSSLTAWSSAKTQSEIQQQASSIAPVYTQSSTLQALVSGELLSVAFSKISKAVASLMSHIINTSNPHSVTKAQVGLGDVENTKLSTWQGSTNLANCNKGAFGNVVTKNIETTLANDANIPTGSAVTSALGDQVTFTLEGDVLTITRK